MPAHSGGIVGLSPPRTILITCFDVSVNPWESASAAPGRRASSDTKAAAARRFIWPPVGNEGAKQVSSLGVSAAPFKARREQDALAGRSFGLRRGSREPHAVEELLRRQEPFHPGVAHLAAFEIEEHDRGHAGDPVLLAQALGLG